MRIARARSVGLSEVMSAIWVLEYLLELSLVGYPLHMFAFDRS